QHRLTSVFDPLLLGADFPEGVRVGVGLRGFRMGPSRQPATADQLADRERLANQIRGLLKGCGVCSDDPSAAATMT
ncbi:MAG: hypothetical protein WCJ18_07335, partial [Planctomycetota bacterium]